MNQYITGETIKRLRIQNKMTQQELAQSLSVSDKTISKWETGRGNPDISLLEPLSKAFNVSVTELVTGNEVKNINLSANLYKSMFYVCPVCGNILYSMGNAMISCHGITLKPLEVQETDEEHELAIEDIEDEWYITSNHDMTKEHFISFIAAISYDRVQLVKLYPEGNCETRINLRGVRDVFYYCNRHGLYKKRILPLRKRQKMI